MNANKATEVLCWVMATLCAVVAFSQVPRGLHIVPVSLGLLACSLSAVYVLGALTLRGSK